MSLAVKIKYSGIKAKDFNNLKSQIRRKLKRFFIGWNIYWFIDKVEEIEEGTYNTIVIVGEVETKQEMKPPALEKYTAKEKPK